MDFEADAISSYKEEEERSEWSIGKTEAQAGIKIAGRNINKLRYAEDTTVMAESEEEIKSLLMKVKDDSEKFA